MPKVNDPKYISEYRSISILPVLSKLYERLILDQILDHIETQQLLAEQKSEYRKGRSTVTMLLKLKSDILNVMKKEEVTLSLMANFAKVFDIVDYLILLKKMHKLRFGKNSL